MVEQHQPVPLREGLEHEQPLDTAAQVAVRHHQSLLPLCLRPIDKRPYCEGLTVHLYPRIAEMKLDDVDSSRFKNNQLVPLHGPLPPPRCFLLLTRVSTTHISIGIKFVLFY